MNGLLWHQAKAALGSRSSRKRSSKTRITRSGTMRHGVRAKTRIMERYLELLKG